MKHTPLIFTLAMVLAGAAMFLIALGLSLLIGLYADAA